MPATIGKNADLHPGHGRCIPWVYCLDLASIRLPKSPCWGLRRFKAPSIWLILIFPVLFTVGICLLDTIDGAMMLTLYTSTSAAKDPIAIMYYSIVLTSITILVAAVIGVIQLLSLVMNVASPTGPFWDGVQNANGHFDIIGQGFPPLSALR